VDVIELILGLHFLRFPVGHAYLCQDPDGLTLIDTSVPGYAAQIAAWGNVTVCAHHADAVFLRGQASGPTPDLADWERPIFDQITCDLPVTPPAPVRIDRELADGDELAFGGDAVVVAAPGHTPGSIAFYLPGTGSCSLAMRQPPAPAARSCPASSMPTALRPPRPSASSPASMPRSPVSATANPVIQGAAAQLQAAAPQLHDDEQ
jgi:hypothetical protein